MLGYAHESYARSLAEFGEPRFLPNAGAWILQRNIPGTNWLDAMSCYPLFCCQNWSQLTYDLDLLASDLVSLTAVTDPFGAYQFEQLQRCFPNLLRRFKDHFVVDLAQEPASFVSRHHLRNARKALGRVQVSACREPAQHADEWVRLYANLVKRHRIRGLAAFSRGSFHKQLQTPGLVLLQARAAGETIGMQLWLPTERVGYYHLGAYRPRGYEMGASFALFWHAIQFFRAAGLRWLSLGAGAGAVASDQDGLTRFKRGWSTDTRPAYLCGRIFQPARYAAIEQELGYSGSDYFPSYRTGEFA